MVPPSASGANDDETGQAAVRLTAQTLEILAVLEPGTEMYGLELAKLADLPPGTTYPILKRLLGAGWLESRPEEVDPAQVGRPRRRLYRLTGLGEEAARSALDDYLQRLARGRSTRLSLSPRPRETPA